jgi:archaellum component FlaF (FlaF/FlaG flagellin family)
MGVNPSSLNFGSVSINTASSPSVVTVTNYGKHNLTIQQASSNLREFILRGPSLPLTLRTGETASFQAVFNPDSANSFSGSLSFITMSGTTKTVLVSGTGIAPPPSPTQTYLLSTSTNSLSFGNLVVGSASGAQTVALTNSGNSTVTVSQVNVTGAGFSVSGISLPLSLAAGQSASLNVGFAPTVAGSVAGSVLVVSNATNSPATMSLSGAGTQPQISVVPTSLSFSNVTVGLTGTQSVVLSNPGSASLNVSQATMSGAGFALSGLNLPLTVGAGQSSVFTVNFTPTTSGSAAATLSLVSNAPGSPTGIPISGTGVAPFLTLSASPTSVSFGNITFASSSGTQIVTLTNTGNTNVSISQINVSGAGFSVSGFTPPLTLAAGQITTFNVIFDPATSGSLSGTVSVVSNATGSPTIALSGTGVQTVAHSATLNWTPSTSSVMGYYVYRGTQTGGPYAKLNATPISLTTYTDSAVQAGQAYFYVATSVDSNNVESSFSNETSAIIPTP